MSRVLVTGGAGFIGSHLCERLLQKGAEVYCLDNLRGNYHGHLGGIGNIIQLMSNPLFHLIIGDIRDERLIRQVLSDSRADLVVHLAALAGVRSSIANSLDYVDVDIKGTAVLLESIKECGVKKFIFASSSSVYGLNNPPFSESDLILMQTSPYAAAKFSGELLCRTYNHLYGISVVCLRFFTVYGPRQRPDMGIYRFVKAILGGEEVIVYGDGLSSRDYTYVDDIIDGIVASIDLDCGFEAINLGNSKPVGILDLIGIIEKHAGLKANVCFEPLMPGEVHATCADITKAGRLLGYKPRIQISDGVERFIKWYKEHSENTVNNRT